MSNWNSGRGSRGCGGHVYVRADELHDRIERGGVADGELAEHLAVQLDAGGDGGGDEAVVVDPALSQGGAEAGDPERAEVPLLLAAIARRVGAGAAGELDRLAV